MSTQRIKDETGLLRLLSLLVPSQVDISLLRGGRPSALEFCVEFAVASFGNRWSEALLSIKEAHLREVSLGTAMTEADGFSPFVHHILYIGESTNHLGKALAFAATLVERTEVLKTAGVSNEQIGVVNFFRILGWMVGQGRPLQKAFEIAVNSSLPKEVAMQISAAVSIAIGTGKTIATGLKGFPELFTNPHMFVCMGMAEEIGVVPETCNQLAAWHECTLLARAAREKLSTILNNED